MFQCIDCGDQNPWHVCPKHETFTIKEPGVIMTPRNAEALAAEVDRLHLQVDGLKKDLAHWKDCHGATADKLEESNRLNDAMKELLSQYQSNVHLFKHDARVAPMDCPVEPCPKTTKAILGHKVKRAVSVPKCGTCGGTGFTDGMGPLEYGQCGNCRGSGQEVNRKCGLSKPLGNGETCVRDVGHSEPCEHRNLNAESEPEPCGVLDATGMLRCENPKGHAGQHYGDNGFIRRDWT